MVHFTISDRSTLLPKGQQGMAFQSQQAVLSKSFLVLTSKLQNSSVSSTLILLDIVYVQYLVKQITIENVFYFYATAVDLSNLSDRSQFIFGFFGQFYLILTTLELLTLLINWIERLFYTKGANAKHLSKKVFSM